MKETLTKQQWVIMAALWARSPMFLSELMDTLAGKVNWTHSAFLTCLKKLGRRDSSPIRRFGEAAAALLL